MLWRGRLCSAAAALVLSLMPGCAGAQRGDRSVALVPSREPFVADVPLPEGFRLVERSCEDWSSASIRYVRHRYRGRADKAAVHRFYRKQMPLVRWTPVSGGNVHGRRTLRFERRAESCTVTIQDAARSLSGEVVVEVLITPAQR